MWRERNMMVRWSPSPYHYTEVDEVIQLVEDVLRSWPGPCRALTHALETGQAQEFVDMLVAVAYALHQDPKEHTLVIRRVIFQHAGLRDPHGEATP